MSGSKVRRVQNVHAAALFPDFVAFSMLALKKGASSDALANATLSFALTAMRSWTNPSLIMGLCTTKFTFCRINSSAFSTARVMSCSAGTISWMSPGRKETRANQCDWMGICDCLT